MRFWPNNRNRLANGLEKNYKQVLMTTGEGPMAVDLKYSGLTLANDHAFYVSG